MGNKINFSWERYRNEVHSPVGVDQLRKVMRASLIKKYLSIAEAMFQYNMHEIPMFEDILQMSRDKVPERWLVGNGQEVVFEYAGQLYILPVVMNGGINMCGEMASWSPVPVGWSEEKRGTNPELDRIRGLKLDWTNSVLWSNDIFGQGEVDVIEKYVDLLLDNMMTTNQLQLLAKAPFVFNVTEDQLLDAKNYFLALCSDRPAIFRNTTGDKMDVIQQTGADIDPALLDLFRHWENLLLEQLGIPGSVQNTKRAQQSVDEINMAEDKTSLRRRDKLLQRQYAVDRINKLWGVGLTVLSVIDSQMDDREDEKEIGDDDDVDN